ncbi:MAG: hypothetical protein JNL50_09280 [Phycisphaerae bacterium]|nr:hypothetical protein [Phycisphaerae bacterium]
MKSNGTTPDHIDPAAGRPRTGDRVDSPAAQARAAARRRRRRVVVAVLLLVPMALMAYKLSGLAGSAALSEWLSFGRLSPELRSRTLHLLVVPLGALVVVMFRLTLGLRVLGPFRSVLLAVAFQVTGALVGIVFFALVLGAVTVLRPLIKRLRLAYFARSAALLSAVAGMIVAAMLVGIAMGVPGVERVAYFPVVVLALSGDAFAVTLRREGARSAVWRAVATAGAALAITAISSIEQLQVALVRFPELLLAVVACVILSARHMKWRLLERWNPVPVRKKRRRAAGAGDASAPAASL